MNSNIRSLFTYQNKDEFSYFIRNYRELSTRDLLLLLGSARAQKSKLIPLIIDANTLTRSVLIEKWLYNNSDCGLKKHYLSEEELLEKKEKFNRIIKALKAELSKREHVPNSKERKQERQWKFFEKKHR